jgi:hypothetical protein
MLSINKLFNCVFKQKVKIVNNSLKLLSSATSVSDRASFPGYKGEFSTSLEFLYPEAVPQIQCYRVMNRKGAVLDQNQDPNVKIFFNKF